MNCTTDVDCTVAHRTAAAASANLTVPTCFGKQLHCLPVGVCGAQHGQQHCHTRHDES